MASHEMFVAILSLLLNQSGEAWLKVQVKISAQGLWWSRAGSGSKLYVIG